MLHIGWCWPANGDTHNTNSTIKQENTCFCEIVMITKAFNAHTVLFHDLYQSAFLPLLVQERCY